MFQAEGKEETEKQDEGRHKKHDLGDHGNFSLPHEFKAVRNVVDRKNDDDVQEHVRQSVGLFLSVDNTVIELSVGEEKADSDQKAPQRKIGIAPGKISMPISASASLIISTVFVLHFTDL